MKVWMKISFPWLSKITLTSPWMAYVQATSYESYALRCYKFQQQGNIQE